ncbi:MAG TPA: hypothetical protein VGB55_13540, partial [Tepidisphaeraceae bacterium]
MGFDSGSMSFQRYAVVGNAPKMPDEEVLKKIDANALRPSDLGQPEEVEYGWAGTRHVFDLALDFERCVYNDCLHFAMRVDTNKVPGEVKQAYLMIEEDAVAKMNPSGFISKQQKRDVKDQINSKLEEELHSGKYRRSKLVPILWDLPGGILYGPSSLSVREKLTELFSRTFDLELFPLSSGTIALRELERRGTR